MCVDPRSCAEGTTCRTLKTSTSALAPAAGFSVLLPLARLTETPVTSLSSVSVSSELSVKSLPLTFHVVDGDRVDAVGETDKVVARAEINRMTEARDRPLFKMNTSAGSRAAATHPASSDACWKRAGTSLEISE